MSIIKQAMSDSVVPLRHATISTVDRVEAVTNPDALFGLLSPGYNLLVNNIDALDGTKKLSMVSGNEVIGEFANNLLSTCLQTGFVIHSPENRGEGEVGFMASKAIRVARTLTREQAITFIAPLFIYARSFIRTRYGHADGFVNLSDIESEPVPKDIEVERVRDYTYSMITRKFMATTTDASGFPRPQSSLFSMVRGDDSLSINSAGIVFISNKEIRWTAFDVVKSNYPGDPYGKSAPSPRAVAARLLKELNSQDDIQLLGIVVSLLTGNICIASFLGELNDTTAPRGFYIDCQNVWSLMFPDEPTSVPIFTTSEAHELP